MLALQWHSLTKLDNNRRSRERNIESKSTLNGAARLRKV